MFHVTLMTPRQQWLAVLRRIQMLVRWEISYFLAVALNFVREVAFQGVRIEESARSARLNESSALPAVYEELTVRWVHELPGRVDFRTLDTPFVVVSSHRQFLFRRFINFLLARFLRKLYRFYI